MSPTFGSSPFQVRYRPQLRQTLARLFNELHRQGHGNSLRIVLKMIVDLLQQEPDYYGVELSSGLYEITIRPVVCRYSIDTDSSTVTLEELELV